MAHYQILSLVTMINGDSHENSVRSLYQARNFVLNCTVYCYALVTVLYQAYQAGLCCTMLCCTVLYSVMLGREGSLYINIHSVITVHVHGVPQVR